MPKDADLVKESDAEQGTDNAGARGRYARLDIGDRQFLEGVMAFGDIPRLELINRITWSALGIFATAAILGALFAGLT